jgi:3-oxoacyl-[acyl-carrier-protein] synthase-3
MPNRIAAQITGIAGYVPPRVLTNADLEKMVDTTDAWIRERTGIAERHIVEKGVTTSDLAVLAAKEVFGRPKLPDEIDLIITATVLPRMIFSDFLLDPAQAWRPKAWGFDLSAACSGFLYALTVGAQFAGSGAHRKVLVIGSDVMSSIIDYKDRNTCVLFGDGAGAVLVEPAQDDGPCILDFHHDVVAPVAVPFHAWRWIPAPPTQKP